MEISLDGCIVLIDDEDYQKVFLAGGKWGVWRHGPNEYVARSETRGAKKTSVRLHRLILDAKPGDIVDHINGNGLDNRRQNLRFVTSAQNNRNRQIKVGGCRFKGVSRRSDRNKWRAMITAEGKQISLGCFDSDVEAAYAYDLASLKHHGEFGFRNFLPLVKPPETQAQ